MVWKRVAWLTLTAALLALAANQAQADFANADGFSGKTGFTCVTCHVSPHPTAPPAEVHLEGAPATWQPNTSYILTIRVTGGPDALPDPAPQGGFEIEANGGRLHRAPGFEDITRPTHLGGMTYQPLGTLMRTWNVTWTAPDLGQAPAPVTLWVAGMSANGNHVIATNVSDQGEKFDNVATTNVTILPDPETIAAWQAIPLSPPNIRVEEGMVYGEHSDANATGIRYTFDGVDWKTRDTSTSWRLDVSNVRSGTLRVQSIGAERLSPELHIDFDAREPRVVEPCDDCQQESPTLPFLAPLGLLAFFTWRSRK